ncbi:hypothetical protein ACH9L7_07690 [Haloferax sp. S1W]|uniref:hypothetical protein n=1 Tax=Haloferax sp. S1W TaxID=3377110 RepID=UPI0037C6C23C
MSAVTTAVPSCVIYHPRLPRYESKARSERLHPYQSGFVLDFEVPGRPPPNRLLVLVELDPDGPRLARVLRRADPVPDDPDDRRLVRPDELDADVLDDRLDVRLDPDDDRDRLDDDRDRLDDRLAEERPDADRLDDEPLDCDVRFESVDRDGDESLRDVAFDRDEAVFDREDGELDCEEDETDPSSLARPGNLNLFRPSRRLLTYFVWPIRS